MIKTDKKITEQKIHPKTTIGHIHLKVSNLQSSIDFYSNVLGFQITNRIENSAAFLSAGDYHHHIGLNTWESLGGTPPPRDSTGLYHFAILVPSRKELALVVKRLLDNEYPIEGVANHGVSEAIYLKDPDDNGIEIYADTPRSEWKYDSQGKIIMVTEHLDIENLLEELEK
jgi:catechol 2,3-dioxygenase